MNIAIEHSYTKNDGIGYDRLFRSGRLELYAQKWRTKPGKRGDGRALGQLLI